MRARVVGARPRIVVFGAFDRHNLGDLLFAHVAEALLGQTCECVFAGLVERDLRALGGHRVRPIAQVAAEAPDALLHAGGEILDCDAWTAAVMLLEPDAAAAIVARLDAKPAERDAWARQLLGAALHVAPASVPRAPYVVSRAAMPNVGRIVFGSVGGVELARREPALRTEVLGALRLADRVTVRDASTHEHLRNHRIDAALVPDPVVAIEALFGERIRSHAATSPALARVRSSLPDGWLAVQFSADFGDDATLATIAAQLDATSRDTGLGIALFRTGAAPWHDTLEVLQAIAVRMHAPTLVFESLDVRDLCALIASSRGFCGSSLHGRIVAAAFGLPRVNVEHPSKDASAAKQRAYAATWEDETQAGVVAVDALHGGLRAALAVDRERCERAAHALAARYLRDFEAVRAALTAQS
ncbi:MAG: polysaccharide pyruvyl transferase family protein [Burkholderiaceae bacterium]|nr:polysaccharide pyruvyl transferase family protein [Burkholderiaceae bacterium]